MADVLNAKMEELIQENGGRGSAKSLPEARVYSPGAIIEEAAPQEKPEPIRPWTATEIETLKAIEEIDPRESQRLRGPHREGAPKWALADYAALKAYDDRFGTDYLRQHITGQAYGLPPE
tara:strand:- start:85 stop:444 length:360 start_codon:yes stop_codon:yes gene_type:complete